MTVYVISDVITKMTVFVVGFALGLSAIRWGQNPRLP